MLSKLFRIALLIPAAYWPYMIFLGDLGADPAKKLNHQAGEISLYYLILNLLVGALIAMAFRFPKWLRFLLQHRRFLGVVTFVYLVFHVFLYLTLEGFEAKAFTQIYTKTYLIFGTSAWLILFVLAITSNNFAVRRMGARRWKALHRFVYLATALITVHVLLIEKADLIKYGLIFLALWSVQLVRWLKRGSGVRSASSGLRQP